ncbi:class I SAM-dependent methyltransferase [Halovivax limisalsi]|uniref:class I SAM-dependent methyltransferase n=1 Tax=Halovivax limisalsi TaxID=1453760 RepID=UPI001FFCE4A7|nr:class I SAM-dependent methyltransferase family protein [Halovivax limisalsi]
MGEEPPTDADASPDVNVSADEDVATGGEASTDEEPSVEAPSANEETPVEASSTDEDPLAVVVDERRTEIAIESLRAEGVYDDARAVRPFDDGRTALPVERPPAATRIDRVVRQVDPEYRPTDLDTLLRERGWSERERDRERAPGSWAVVGDVVLVTIPPDCPDEGDVADALLELHGGAETVLADEGVSGRFREPRTRHLAGETDTETVHVEHGTAYALDPAAVMFSPGNQAERVRMGEVVEPDERVFDMFAGIGYFTLPMARAGANVTATELNPTAFRYLIENAVRNDVTDDVAAYNTDCRELAGSVDADRVVMGYYGIGAAAEPDDERSADESEDADPTTGSDAASGDDSAAGRRRESAVSFLPAALESLASDGVIHLHAAVHESDPRAVLDDRITDAVASRGRSARIRDRRRVKTHSAGVVHVVLDVAVS